ncbi:hypothetical protein DMH12_04530 [Streptomyces sp. WAC 04229]|uniref:hypothetical protein n=1 Tax=Streptomyces sp. WAC 04229 TaxID=2203206 RepID=UPI000F737BBF|nr:hypothetical protein [Streptomyces sp. WAC 04229]RSN64042.1 hypothetical protein DMH12_04530 [Streptomyces sp. WAC 04229]
MATRLRFVLDGDDQLSPVLNHAGDSSARLHRRLDGDMRANTTAVRGFTRDADGRLRDLQGRFLSVADAQRAMAGGLPDLTNRLGDVSSAGGDAATALGKGGGGLGGAMGAVAGVAALSLLPALGALVPMMAGVGLAAVTMKLGFAGVGDAVEAAGKGQEEYAEALEKLSPPAREFTKELVGLKKEFSGVGKEIQAAMLPGFTKALKEAGPVTKILRGEMVNLGGAFGDAAAGLGRMMKDSGFQDSLRTNLQLGSTFVRDMTSALGPFTRSLLDFGAASGPTLKAFSDGIGGLLSRGLPGFFQGLIPGIDGSAKMLDGLFSAVNTILPALGRLAGTVADMFGPAVGENLKLFGNATGGVLDSLGAIARGAKPIFDDLTFGVRTLNDLGQLLAPTMSDVGSAILGGLSPAGDAVNRTVGPFERLHRTVQDNKIGILEVGRVFGNATIGMASSVIGIMPTVIGAFKQMSTLALTAVGVMIGGLAKAFGDVPIIGEKLKKASEGFDTFKGKWIGALDEAQSKAKTFAAEALPKLEQGKLKMNINNWEQQIATAKAKLNSLPLDKQAKLRAHIADLEAKVRSAKGQLASIRDKSTFIKAVDRASPVIGGALGMLRAANGRTATTYIVTHYQAKYDNAAARPFRRNGGHAPKFAAGGMPSGMLSGPGTGTSDSIPMWWAGDGEYVVNARSTAKHRNLIEAINNDTLGTGGAEPGPRASTAESGQAAGQGLVTGMGQATGDVNRAAALMASAITAGIKTEMQIASPSKKTKALAADIGQGLIVGLTGSQAKIRSVAADLVKDIRTAFSGRKESSLVSWVNKQTKSLLSAAAKRDKVASQIAAAKAYAYDLQKRTRESGYMQQLGLEDEQVTAGSIQAGLASKLSKLRQFTKYIDILKKQGLRGALLRQILDMGPEQGYAYASALVGASKSTLSQINSLDKQLESGAVTLGRNGADALWDAGKNAGKGFLAGLEGQKKDIENLMMRIAKSMQSAIKKSLGIRSPSTVMARLGSYSTEGLAVGLAGGLPHVDRAMQSVAGRITGKSIAAPARAGRAAVTAGAGGQVINANFSISDALDPMAVAREVQRLLLQLGRAQGAKVSINLGGV